MEILNILNKTIEYFGIGNIISIITFLIGLFISYYFYFKSFYRLVYSTNTICKTCKKTSDWSNPENMFRTRILIYNNGRKTLSAEQINKLEIISSGKIDNIIILKNIEGLSTNIDKKIAKLNFENLDSTDFIVLEVAHNGNINLEGRVVETGKLLHTEPRNWVILNGFFVIFITLMLFYNMHTMLGKENPDIWLFTLNFIVLYGIFMVIRFIHQLLFIPDSLSNRYLETKDKWSLEFNN